MRLPVAQMLSSCNSWHGTYFNITLNFFESYLSILFQDIFRAHVHIWQLLRGVVCESYKANSWIDHGAIKSLWVMGNIGCQPDGI